MGEGEGRRNFSRGPSSRTVSAVRDHNFLDWVGLMNEARERLGFLNQGSVRKLQDLVGE